LRARGARTAGDTWPGGCAPLSRRGTGAGADKAWSGVVRERLEVRGKTDKRAPLVSNPGGGDGNGRGGAGCATP
jgi:hypothetical protein